MDECERLTTLIADIYDASLDSNLWPRALEGVQDFVGGCASNLFWQDTATEKVIPFYACGFEPRYIQLYGQKYQALNPLYPAGAFIECGVVTAARDLIPASEMADTRFFKEWLQPQGYIDSLFVNLDRTATSSSVVGVFRSSREGPADAGARRRMGLLAPHLMRAAAIGLLIDRKNAAVGALSTVLASLSTAAFLVDAGGRTTFVNPAGEALLRRGDALRTTNGALIAQEPAAARALRNAIAAAAQGDAEFAAQGVAIPLSQDEQVRWLAHVLPLASSLRKEAAGSPAAVAAIFVRRVELDTPSALETLARLYRLTAGEVRAFQAIVDLGGVQPAAEALGVAENTVKTHVSKIFAKTGVRRQADLVKLMATHASPFGR